MQKVILMVVLLVSCSPNFAPAQINSLSGRVPSLPLGLSNQEVVVDLGCILEAKLDSEGHFTFPPSNQLSSILSRKTPISIDVMSKDGTKVYLSALLLPGQRFLTIDGMSTALSRTCLALISRNPKQGIWTKAAALPEMVAFAEYIEKTGASSGDEYHKLVKSALKAVQALQSAPITIPPTTIVLPEPFPTEKPSSNIFSHEWPKKSKQEKERFLANVRKEAGLSTEVPPHIMAATWYRLSFALARQYTELGFLFTKQMKEKIAAGPDRELARSLYNLFKFYYHAGIKMGHGDKKTFATISNLYEGNFEESPKIRTFARGGMKIRWCLEEGSWRFDDISR